MTMILQASTLSEISRPAADAVLATSSAAVANNQPTGCRLDGCSFCNLGRGFDDKFVELYGASPEVDLPGVPENVMVVMDGFPIGDAGGHLLIVPRQHVPSLAKSPNEEGIRTALERITEVLSAMFPDHWLFTFEHGMGELSGNAVKCGGCHVDHAHGHVVLLPKTVDFEEIRDAVELTLEELGWDLDDQRAETDVPFVEIAPFTEGQPYLQIGVLAGDSRRAYTYRQESSSQSIPSQLLRRIVSEAMGKAAPVHWNWKIALQRNLTDRLEKYRQAAISFKTAVADYVETVNQA